MASGQGKGLWDGGKGSKGAEGGGRGGQHFPDRGSGKRDMEGILSRDG